MQTICKLGDIVPETGVCALVDGKQIAIFRTRDDRVFAIDNFDPFSKANVLARGLIGGTKDDDGEEVLYVASPIYKQRFNLATGACLDNEHITLGSYLVSVNNGEVCIES